VNLSLKYCVPLIFISF